LFYTTGISVSAGRTAADTVARALLANNLSKEAANQILINTILNNTTTYL
jgi:hypothetical protein